MWPGILFRVSKLRFCRSIFLSPYPVFGLVHRRCRFVPAQIFGLLLPGLPFPARESKEPGPFSCPREGAPVIGRIRAPGCLRLVACRAAACLFGLVAREPSAPADFLGRDFLRPRSFLCVDSLEPQASSSRVKFRLFAAAGSVAARRPVSFGPVFLTSGASGPFSCWSVVSVHSPARQESSSSPARRFWSVRRSGVSICSDFLFLFSRSTHGFRAGLISLFLLAAVSVRFLAARFFTL
jgi:hypothetical protein